MREVFVFLCYYFNFGVCSLWPKGVVHYGINPKDYDLHSQDEILSTLAQLQKEVCVKFFRVTANYTSTVDDKILYISNPDKTKDCLPDYYDYSRNVVDMTIGYRCINAKDITRIVVDMLRASIDQTFSTVNSFDLIKKFIERDENAVKPGLLASADRNYINAHYHAECGVLSEPVSRRSGPGSADNISAYYQQKLWPLGVVMYGVGDVDPFDLKKLNHAMTTIELSSCVVFQRLTDVDVLIPKNILWFSKHGEDMPNLGFREGNQTLKLSVMTHGAPGHTSHALNMLLRVLGVPMMSNRFDRDNYVTVNWNRVEQGKEHYLEKAPRSAWLTKIPYDFSSATHAPANYMCKECQSPTNYQTVLPLQDHLWQRTMSMGHRVDLSDSDKQILSTLYGNQCQERFIPKD